MNTRRVIVVEDDETLGEFFTMVLEMMPVRYALCRTGEEAVAALREAPADVLVTDLLLPGLDGRGLLKTLRADAQLRGPARLVVMSGSIDDAVRREMAQNGVWRVLAKPVTVKAFKSCVEEALADRQVAPQDNLDAPSPPLTADERATVESHFAGQIGLYLAYRDGCFKQFPRDIEQGDRALKLTDIAGLRRVAHNLKGVLLTLGHHGPCETARQLENATAAWLDRPHGGLAPDDAPASLPDGIRQGWERLRDELPMGGNRAAP